MATQLNKSMVSEVAIANIALGWLGANSIRSLDDPSTTAELMRENYPFIRDAVMTEAAWMFATARQTSTVADKSEWGNKFKHPVPVDWLQVLRVFRDVSTDRELPSKSWVREGNFILTREGTVYLRGIKRITDTALFHPAFVQCLAARLAADLCMTITQNQKQQGLMLQLYGVKLDEAKNGDGIQGDNEVIQSENLIDARAGAGVGAGISLLS